MKREPDGGFVLLDAIISIFVLSVGVLSSLYGLSVFLKATGNLDRAVVAYTEQENARTESWFSLATPTR